jgi:hypothetical protein
MNFLQQSPERMDLVLGAIRAMLTVPAEPSPPLQAAAPGALTPQQRQLLEIIQQHLLPSSTPIAQLPVVDPDHLARGLSEAQGLSNFSLRTGAIAVITLALLIDGVTPAQVGAMRLHFELLQVKDSYHRPLRQLVRGQHRRLAWETYNRCFIAQKYRFELQRRGAGWLVRGSLGYLGWGDRTLAARYQGLAQFPADTLGYAFWQFSQRHHYPFPGEPGGNHEGLSFHDVTHILGGYDTSGLGELQAVAMTAGYQYARDPGEAMAALWFILLQQHLGVQIGLLSSANRGLLQSRRSQHLFFKALAQGLAMPVDLSQEWDLWEVVSQPLDQVRLAYGLAGE